MVQACDIISMIKKERKSIRAANSRIFQIEGGPQVRVFLENNTLRAAQMPNP
jgi:mevalonate pyrophosphate decarboxylase